MVVVGGAAVVVGGAVVVAGGVVVFVVVGGTDVVGSTEVEVGGELVVVGAVDVVIGAGTGEFVVVVDVADLEQPMPAASSDNNTSAIITVLKSLFIVFYSLK